MTKLLGIITCIALLNSACGGDDKADGSGGSSATGGAAGSGGSAGTGGTGDSITFVVLDGSVCSKLGEAPKLAGATVAFDAPGGTRTELASGADGKVTFQGIDWSKGNATVTAYLEHYSLWSAVDFDSNALALAPLPDGAVPLHLIRSTPPMMVTVSGTATGLKDAAHSYVVNVVHTSSGSEWGGVSSGTFKVSVPTGQPFTLQGIELTPDTPLPSNQGYDMPVYQVMTQDFDAITADKTGVVLDFAAHAVTTKTASISVKLPTRAESPVRKGRGVSWVCPWESVFCTGWATHIDISADGTQFDASLLWHEPPWAKHPMTRVHVVDGTLGFDNVLTSFRSVNSWPTSGSIGALPDTPEWVTPAPGAASHPLYQAIEWKLFEDAPYAQLWLNSGARVAWLVAAAPKATTLTVPEPPSTVDLYQLFGDYLYGSVQTGWVPTDANCFEALAATKRVKMMLP